MAHQHDEDEDETSSCDSSEELELPEIFQQFLDHERETHNGLSRYPKDGKWLGEELIAEFFKMKTMNLDREEEEIARHRHCNYHKNSVAIIGDPGMGKTQMVQNLVNKIRHKKLWVHTKIIFFLKVDEIDFSIKQHMKDFLLSGLIIRCTEKNLTDKQLKDMEEGDSCMVVIDGIDTAKTNAFKKDDQLELYLAANESTADVHIKNLLVGRVFQGAKKVLTCRRHEFFELAPAFRPFFVITCNGLHLREGYREVAESECDSPKEVRLMMKFLDNHPELQKVCHVPVVCLTVVHFLKQNINILASTDALLSMRQNW